MWCVKQSRLIAFDLDTQASGFGAVAVGELVEGGDQTQVVEGRRAQVVDQAPHARNGVPKLRAQFFRTGPMSLPVLATATVLLGIPALLAVAIPSRRAALLEPAVTLRRD